MLYESDEDRKAQGLLAWTLELLGFDVQETSTQFHYDFVLSWKGKEYAVVEFKRRREKLVDPYYIDEQKVRSVIGAAKHRNCKPVLIVQSGNGPYYITVLTGDYSTRQFQRRKNAVARNETEDTVCEIPLTAFSILGQQ